MLTLKAGQSQLVDKLSQEAAFTGGVSVAACQACVPPSATVVGPRSISEPCDESSQSDITFDASYSSDPSKRSLRKIQWSQAGAPNPTLQVFDAVRQRGTCVVIMHRGVQVCNLPVLRVQQHVPINQSTFNMLQRAPAADPDGCSEC